MYIHKKQIESLDFLCYFCFKTNLKVYQIGSYRNALVASYTWQKSALDYTTFGSSIPELQYAYSDGADTSKYRFGFNGQEKDNEVSGEDNSYTAEYWQFDSRLGRRFNIDPKSLRGVSGYSCFLNNPIVFVDQNGDSVGFAKPLGETAKSITVFSESDSKVGGTFYNAYQAAMNNSNIDVLVVDNIENLNIQLN